MRLPKSLLVTTCSAALFSGVPTYGDETPKPDSKPTQVAKAESAGPEVMAPEVLTEKSESEDESPETSAAGFIPPEGFQALLPPEGLSGWIVQEGKASAWIRDGEILSCISATGGWLRTEATYSDFQLRLEYRLQAGGNTGIGIRAPAAGNPTFTGMEIQLLDGTSPKYADLRADQYTGSIYYQVPASQEPELNPPGEWNVCEIRCCGDTLRVRINGETVNEIHLVRREKKMDRPQNGDEPPPFSLAQRPPLGHIALQSHSTRIDFRRIVLKDLTEGTESGLHYVDLEEGTGQAVSDETTVTVHYVGQLTDGKRFTDTRDAGEPVTVTLSDVIPGLKEGIQGMKVGGQRRLIVPPHLAYGATGVEKVIPPDATLVFEVELCGFE